MLWNKGASWALITSYLYFDHDIMAMTFKRIWAYNIRSIHCAEASHVYDELKLVLKRSSSDKCFFYVSTRSDRRCLRSVTVFEFDVETGRLSHAFCFFASARRRRGRP